MSTNVARFLRKPLAPKDSPVTILHLRADNDRNGNPRRAYAVLTPTGRVVEVHDEGYEGSAVITKRWPWFQHHSAGRLGLRTAYDITVDVTPSEYKRWLRRGLPENLDTDTPELVGLRHLGDRMERHSLIWDALSDVHRAMAEHERREMIARRDQRPNHYGDTSAALIYHRKSDPATDYLRRALGAMVRAGMLTATNVDDVSGYYRATDTTPLLDR